MNGVSALWVLTGLAGLIGVLIVWLQRHPEQMGYLMKTSGEKGVMSAQYDPHTPPLWRRVLSLPHTRLGWWAVGLVGIFWGLIGIFWVLSVYFFGHPVGLVALVWLLGAAAGGVVALIALLRGHEQSALVWVAMVLGLVAFLYYPIAAT
jgi:hypothetical protein